jgi:hypothetical protein
MKAVDVDDSEECHRFVLTSDPRDGDGGSDSGTQRLFGAKHDPCGALADGGRKHGGLEPVALPGLGGFVIKVAGDDFGRPRPLGEALDLYAELLRNVALQKREVIIKALSDGYREKGRTLDDYYAESLAYGPDGRTLAVGGSNYVRLIDASTGEQLTEARIGGVVDRIAFTNDGSRLVVAADRPHDAGAKITIRDAATLRPIGPSIEPGRPYQPACR